MKREKFPPSYNALPNLGLYLLQVFFCLSISAIGFTNSSQLAPDVSKAKSATASVFGLLDRNSKIDSSDDSGMTLEELKGNIEFRNVDFKYPTRPDVQILQGLCLTIQSGKVNITIKYLEPYLNVYINCYFYCFLNNALFPFRHISSIFVCCIVNNNNEWMLVMKEQCLALDNLGRAEDGLSLS